MMRLPTSNVYRYMVSLVPGAKLVLLSGSLTCSLSRYRKSLPDEVIPGLFIGGVECATHLESLLHRKIGLVIQIMVEAEQHFPRHFTYLTYKISDHPTSVHFPQPSIMDLADSFVHALRQDLSVHFQTCIDKIGETMQQGGGALVHWCIHQAQSFATGILTLDAVLRVSRAAPR